MNRRDLESMRERLASRHAAEAEDHPAVLALAMFLLGLAVVLAAFL